MRLVADRARAAESATLRSALMEVRAEAAKGAAAFHRAEDAERELRRRGGLEPSYPLRRLRRRSLAADKILGGLKNAAAATMKPKAKG
eukprot:g22779.t1